MSRLLRVFRVQLVVLIVAGGLVMGIGPADGLTLRQTCVGTEVTSYDPPLTFVSRPTTITVNGLYPNCTDSGASSGSYSETFSLTASCLALLDSGTTVRVFAWNNRAAETSTFDYNVTATEVGGQLVVTNSGLITAGRYAPGSAQQVITLVTPNILQCLGSGISNVAGPSTLLVYGP